MRGSTVPHVVWRHVLLTIIEKVDIHSCMLHL